MRAWQVIVAGVAIVLAGCAGASGQGAARVNDAERMRAGLVTGDVAKLAPKPFAAAEEELKQAKASSAAGDTTSAELHGERAVAMFTHASAVARLARATLEAAAATEALQKASGEVQALSTQRKAVDHEADDLEKKLRVAREAQTPPASGPAGSPERERARVVAAQSLVTQARLLCGAARLVSAQAPGLLEAETTVAALEKQAEGAKSVAIDPAARARAACLSSLTRTRRGHLDDPDRTDALLAELSQATGGTPAGGAPTSATADTSVARDERGVVLTMRSAFQGDQLATGAQRTVEDLGRVAAAHPTFAVQVVVHDAQAPTSAEASADQRRGDAILRALVAGGATASRIKVEQAGARAPVVDPRDTRHAGRNARVEIVFVSGAAGAPNGASPPSPPAAPTRAGGPS